MSRKVNIELNRSQNSSQKWENILGRKEYFKWWNVDAKATNIHGEREREKTREKKTESPKT